jgi:hypothetical protein
MAASSDSLVILIPGFSDRAALGTLLRTLNQALIHSAWRTSVLIVDEDPPKVHNWPIENYNALDRVEILHLRCGLGPQRAIALGLYHAHEHSDAAAVLIMPCEEVEEVPRLLNEFESGGRNDIVFGLRPANRKGVTFRFLFRTYRLAHRLLTGIEAQVGRFSVLPRSAIHRLMACPELWNHYASAVHRAALPTRQVLLADRTNRSNQSRPRLVTLFLQGLTAMAVFSDRVSVRLLSASAAFAGFALGMIVLTAFIRLFTGFPVPVWATYLIGLLLALVLQPLTFAILFAFLVATRRSAVNFILQRDAPYFILGKSTVQACSPVPELSAQAASSVGLAANG